MTPWTTPKKLFLFIGIKRLGSLSLFIGNVQCEICLDLSCLSKTNEEYLNSCSNATVIDCQSDCQNVIQQMKASAMEGPVKGSCRIHPMQMMINATGCQSSMYAHYIFSPMEWELGRVNSHALVKRVFSTPYGSMSRSGRADIDWNVAKVKTKSTFQTLKGQRNKLISDSMTSMKISKYWHCACWWQMHVCKRKGKPASQVGSPQLFRCWHRSELSVINCLLHWTSLTICHSSGNSYCKLWQSLILPQLLGTKPGQWNLVTFNSLSSCHSELQWATGGVTLVVSHISI